MTVHTLDIDLGKNTFHVIGLDERGGITLKRRVSRSQLAVLLGTCRAASSRWRPAPARITWRTSSRRTGIPCASSVIERRSSIKCAHSSSSRAAHCGRDESRCAASCGDSSRRNPPGSRHAWSGCLARSRRNGASSTSRSTGSRPKSSPSAARDADCQRLMEVPGLGPISATAVVAAVGNGGAFSNGRKFTAWLGLAPRQHSTGGKPRLLGISKCGNTHLRRLFVLGAQSVLRSKVRDRQRFGPWLTQLEHRVHRNVAAVALANKLARIAWAVLARESSYRAQFPEAA